MTFKLVKLNDTIPCLMECSRQRVVKDDGVTPLVNSDICIINPLRVKKYEGVVYAYTLLPFREDMFAKLSNFTPMTGVNHYSDDTISHKEFEVSSVDGVLKFFYTDGGKPNPVMKEWVYTPKAKEIWKVFMADTVNSDCVLKKIVDAINK